MSTHRAASKALASFKVDNIKSNALLIDALGGDDRITGGSAAQTIYGGSGKDVIRGGGGDDILGAMAAAPMPPSWRARTPSSLRRP